MLWLTFDIDNRSISLQWPSTSSSHTKSFETAARYNRYKVLLDACLQNDVRYLLLGHHYDDQLETVLMRLAAGSGAVGLAGMKELSAFVGSRMVYGGHHCKLVRPLLSIEKVP